MHSFEYHGKWTVNIDSIFALNGMKMVQIFNEEGVRIPVGFNRSDLICTELHRCLCEHEFETPECQAILRTLIDETLCLARTCTDE